FDSDSPGPPRHHPDRAPPRLQWVAAPHGCPGHSAPHTRSRPASAPSPTNPPQPRSRNPLATTTATRSSLRNSPHSGPAFLPTGQLENPSPPVALRTDPTHTSHRPDSRHSPASPGSRSNSLLARLLHPPAHNGPGPAQSRWTPNPPATTPTTHSRPAYCTVLEQVAQTRCGIARIQRHVRATSLQ